MYKLLLISFLIIESTIGFSQSQETKIELDSGIYIVGVVETFNPENHQIDSCDVGASWQAVCLIDGSLWYGSDISPVSPRNQLKRLSVNIHGEEVNLDVSGMYNPSYKNVIYKKHFSIKRCNEGYCLKGWFSDGAGTYVAMWKIIKDKSMRILISNDETYFR